MESSGARRWPYLGSRPPSPPLRCAWLVLIKDAEDTPGALVTSGSLKLVGTKYPIVHLQLADPGRAAAKGVLSMYDRILVVGPRVVFVANADELFELAVPAFGSHVREHRRSVRAQVSAGDALVLLDPSAELAQRFFWGLLCDDADVLFWASTIPLEYLAAPWRGGPTLDLRALSFPEEASPGQLDRICGEPYASVWRQTVERIAKSHPGAARALGGRPAEWISPLDADLAQLQLTDALVRHIVRHGQASGQMPAPGRAPAPSARPSPLREATSIVERWLLAMINAPGENGEGELDGRASWAKVYRRSTFEDEFNNKLAGELREKHFAKTDTDAGVLVGELLAAVEQCLARPPPRSHNRASCNEREISYGDFSRPLTPRIIQLMNLGSCEAALAVVLRYEVILSTGQQWGLPQAHIDYLYKEFRVRGEAFSSPLNARLLGKPGAVICSAFPDTDTAFGLVGDFFAQDLQKLDGNWYVNPPFIEDMLARAARHILASLDPDHPQTFFFVAPAWTTSEAYAALHNSRYLIAELRLEPRRYFYEDPGGQRIDTKATSIYFALSTESGPVRARLLDALSQVLI